MCPRKQIKNQERKKKKEKESRKIYTINFVLTEPFPDIKITHPPPFNIIDS